MKKVYISDFVEQFNYTSIILHVQCTDNFNELKEKLNADMCNHMRRFDAVRESGYFYIENCDLQDITLHSRSYFDVVDSISIENYQILNLYHDTNGFYIQVIDD